MNEFIRAMDGLPKLVKILLAIPCLDIIWVIYRLVKSINANDMIFLIVAVLLIISIFYRFENILNIIQLFKSERRV